MHKKKLMNAYTVCQRRGKVDREESLRIVKQCALLRIDRSGYYYTPATESPLNLELMQWMDKQHLDDPFLGVRRMTQWLTRDKGYVVHEKRIAKLYRKLQLHTLYPKPKTTVKGTGPEHQVFPYLLRNLKVTEPHQVWATDITYIPVQGGYLYLCAIIDHYSRYVVGWDLSNAATTEFCLSIVHQAINRYGSPQILHTDQGSPFTAKAFTNVVTKGNIQWSMDGKGRCMDNVLMERLWRSVKYEKVYLEPSSDGIECYKKLEAYFEFYNHIRRHQSLEHLPPVKYYQHESTISL